MKEEVLLRKIAFNCANKMLRNYIIGLPLNYSRFVNRSNRYLDLKKVLHSICISEKKMETCGGGQSYLKWKKSQFYASKTVLYNKIFAPKSHRNISNIHEVITFCAKRHSSGVKGEAVTSPNKT